EIFQAFLQAGGRRQLFNFSFIEPYLFGTAYTMGFNVFERETDFLDFVQAGTGASVQVGRRVGDFSRVDFTYLFENVTVRQTGSPDLESNTSSVTPVFTFNTLNNFFRPTRGYRMRFLTEVAGGALGGDNYFFKPILENTLYLPAIHATYFGLNAEIGWVEPFGTLNGLDREVPGFERFYLGGDRSLRAFPSRSVSPTRVETFPPTDLDGDGDLSDEDLNGNGVLDTEDSDGDGTLDQFLPGGQITSFPGGNKFLLLNGEFVIPVGESVEVGFFVDAGNAFDDDESLDLQDLRLDYGLETRFYLPVFQAPLRLIYGIIYDPRPGEDSSNFQFSIGRTF
ncbi:MAG: BamA/TamA family outer membrane protein, partial [Acidobacteria bacterium]|nr:BamA/TamA family outer membrane protein [Acidobacteriota bacterium]